jgi:hypothetical protein
MSRVITFLKSLYASINGNKTIVGLAAYNILMKWPLQEPYNSIALVIISVWTGASAYDHFVNKKALTKNYK